MIECVEAELACVLGRATIDHLFECERADAADRRIVVLGQRVGDRDHRARILRSRQRERGGEADLVTLLAAELAHVLIDRVRGGRAHAQDHHASGHHRQHARHHAHSNTHAQAVRATPYPTSEYDWRKVSVFDSLRVAGAMARVTMPSLVDIMRGSLEREAVDERTRWFGKRVVEVLGVHLTATGAERVPPGRAYVYMSNHQSHLDIPMLYATLPSPTIRMIGKQELFRIPLWGSGLRAAEFIAVDRSNHVRAMKSIAEAARLIRDGVSIYLAPEGTRSIDGRIGPLKKGGFHLAKDTATPIVPVAIRGTIDILPRGSRAMKTGQPVEVTIGAPIAVEDREIGSLIDEVSRFFKAHVER